MANRADDILQDLADRGQYFTANNPVLKQVNASEASTYICERIRLLWGGQMVYFKSVDSDKHKASTNPGDSLLEDVADIAAETFCKFGVAESEAEPAAAGLAREFHELLSGQFVYIRKLDATYYPTRDQEILTDFQAGMDKKELCLKYGIGYHRLQQILKTTE